MLQHCSLKLAPTWRFPNSGLATIVLVTLLFSINELSLLG